MTSLTILGFIIALICAIRLFRRIEDLEQHREELSTRLTELEIEQVRLRSERDQILPADAAGKPEPAPKPETVLGAPDASAPSSPFRESKLQPREPAVSAAKPGATPGTARTAPPPLPKMTAVPMALSAPKMESSPPDAGPPTPFPAPEHAFEWRPVLEKLNLWPPSGETAEAALAGWWLTRTGLVLFIIAAVFFGVRISEEVSPWLRIASLGGIAAAVVSLGAWIERKLPAFGRVLSAGGLALGYFTAFAAYALPPTKVIPDTLAAVGVLAQAAALAAMVGWSLWKRDEAVAAMGILLGYVSCWFSWHHDLDHFVIPGLLLLATGGGILLNLRGWLIAQAITAPASWFGFLLLAAFKWNGGDAPGLPLMLGSLLALAAVLEASAFLATERFLNKPVFSPPWLRRLTVFSTSAFLVTGYLATRLAYPDHLSTYYLSAAILLLVFTALRFWRRHHTGLVETYFLKASALIALYLVAEFDGPVRWLSLSGQSIVLLWTFRKTRFLAIEIGFAAIFAGALGAIVYDLLQSGAGSRSIFDVFGVVGSLSLTVLSTALALHGKWSARKGNKETGGGAGAIPTDPRPALRIIAAIVTGVTAAALMLTPSGLSTELSQTLFLSALALFLMSPTLFFPQPAPFLAGFTALLFAYPAFCSAVHFSTGNHGSLPIGLWMIALGFGLPAAILRLWPMDWKCGPFFRATLHGLAVLTTAITLCRAANDWDLKMPALLLPLFATTIAGAAALIAQNLRLRLEINPVALIAERFWQWSLAAGIGIVILYTGFATLRSATYMPVFFLLAAAGLIATAFRTRNAIPALAGGIPFFAGLFSYLAEFSGRTPMQVHLTCAMAMIAVATIIALVLWRRVNVERFPAGIPLDAVLHAASLLVLHWFFRSQLDSAGQVFFAGSATATALFFIARRYPFHSLPAMTLVPVGLALLHSAIPSPSSPGTNVWWWAAAVLLLIWLQLTVSTHHEKAADGPGIHQVVIVLSEALASLCLTLIAFRSFEDPWIAVPLAGFAFLLAVLSRQSQFRTLLWWSLLPLALAFPAAISRILSAPANGWQTEMLIAVSVAVLFLIAHGIALAWRRGRLRPVTWSHGIAGLGLFFYACSGDFLGIASWATVCWGLAAIVLFVAGLFAGLRPYRLTGLAGLALCLGRVFLVDLEHPLYRIYAFFAISIVLLSAGYLYHRFRRFIDAADGVVSD